MEACYLFFCSILVKIPSGLRPFIVGLVLHPELSFRFNGVTSPIFFPLSLIFFTGVPLHPEFLLVVNNRLFPKSHLLSVTGSPGLKNPPFFLPSLHFSNPSRADFKPFFKSQVSVPALLLQLNTLALPYYVPPR